MAPKSEKPVAASVKPKGKLSKRGKKSVESWKIYIYKVSSLCMFALRRSGFVVIKSVLVNKNTSMLIRALYR
jgi:hypothetical protein